MVWQQCECVKKSVAALRMCELLIRGDEEMQWISIARIAEMVFPSILNAVQVSIERYYCHLT